MRNEEKLEAVERAVRRHLNRLDAMQRGCVAVDTSELRTEREMFDREMGKLLRETAYLSIVGGGQLTA